MKNDNKPPDVLELPHMAEIFEALRRGRHLCIRDGAPFHALKQNAPLFEALFAKLGFKLIHHARDFFYFLDTSNFTDLSSRIAVFMFILVEHLADQGEAVEEAVMTHRFAYTELPHLQGERYLTYMREAGVASPDELSTIVRTMERFGFARRMDAETFCFDTPIYRFLDLCMEMAAQASRTEAAPPATVPDAQEVSP